MSSHTHLLNMELNEIKTKRQLAYYLGIDYKELTYILYSRKTDNLYISFEIPKKNGEMRNIHAPINPLKHLQRRLAVRLEELQKKYYSQKNYVVHGFTKGRGIITNGKLHRNKKYVINIDLENFFESFHFGRVKGYFQKNNKILASDEIAQCIANIACYKGTLPQGAPSSPIITNMICSIMDRKICSVAKKYRLVYTRYADDLTFSTNSNDILDNLDDFLKDLKIVIDKSGFKINHTKTRISYYKSRQEVTGLVVNNKIAVKREFYRTTRTMLDHLYRGLPFEKNGEVITKQQIEGRLAFINQIDRYNNSISTEKKTVYKGMNAREKQYQLFLFYKYFLSYPKPLIVTEGKTDVGYLRAALRSLYERYPRLIYKKEDGTFEYRISFIKRTPRLEYFFGFNKDGADSIKNIYNLYRGGNNFPDLFDQLSRRGVKPTNPVILIFDNEQISDKPLNKFLKFTKNPKISGNDLYIHLFKNLYILTNPLVNGKEECEIEDLFPDDILSVELGGKKFDRKGEDSETGFSKEIFSRYVTDNVDSIDFVNFIPLLDGLDKIIEVFKNTNVEMNDLEDDIFS